MIDKNIEKQFAKGKKRELKKGGRAVIYQRVSYIEQEDGFSPETQIERCQEWAKARNYQVIKIFQGKHESAKSDTKRKRFNEMLKFVKDKKNNIDAVIVYSTSRFSRTGSFNIVDELKEKGVTVFSATSGYDARTAEGEFMQGVELLSARHDNQIKSKAVIDNGRKALLSGRWIQHPPRGYKMETTKTKQEITINEEGKLIKKAFKMKAEENLTNEEIRIRMRAMGLNLEKQQWSKIFKNIFYAGYYSHNFLNGEIVKGSQEPLVSIENFMKINGMLEKAHTNGYEVKLDKEYAPLLGTIKCPICGGNLTASLSTKMRKKYGKEIGYYVCSHKNCKCNASTKKVNERFEDYLNDIKLSDNLTELLKKQLEKAFPILNKEGMEEIKAIKSNLKNKENEIELIEYNLATATSPQMIKSCCKQLEKKEAERDEILRQLEERDNSILNLDSYINLGLNMKDNILKLWQIANLGNKKRIQNLTFPNGLIYNKENDDIEPISINEFIFLLNSKSDSYKDKKKRQTIKNNDLSLLVPGAGLEPAQPQWPKDFKSFVSTIPPSGR